MLQIYLVLNYADGKCTRQCAGINKLSSVPIQIATYLKLADTIAYNGQLFLLMPVEIINSS